MNLQKIIYSRTFTVLWLLFAVVVYQTMLTEIISIKGVKFDLALLILCYLAFTAGPRTAMIFGFWAGLLIDVNTPDKLGMQVLIKTVLGFTIGNFKETLFLENAFAKGLIIFGSVILNDLLYNLPLLNSDSSAYFYIIYRYTLFTGFYTALLGFLWFSLKERKLPLKPYVS